MRPTIATPSITTSYERMLDDIRNAASVRRAPAHPGPSASREALDAYRLEYENYHSNMEAERLQTQTLQDSQDDRRKAEKLLFERGIIGDKFSSSILLRECKPVRDFVEFLDSCTNSLKDATFLTVNLQRTSDSLPFGLELAVLRPWNDFVSISKVPKILPAGVTVTQLPSSSSSSSSSFSSYSSSALSKADGFALMMNGRKRSREEIGDSLTPLPSQSDAMGTFGSKRMGGDGFSSSSFSSSSSSSSTSIPSFKSSSSTIIPPRQSPPPPPPPPSFSLEVGDHIIGVEGTSLTEKAFPDKNGFKTFLELQRKAPLSSSSSTTRTTTMESSSSSSSSSSALPLLEESSTSEEQFTFDSHALSWVCTEMKKKLSVQLQIRRLSAEGSLFAVQLESGRPAWLFDTPIAPLRSAIVSLLNSEKTLLKFKDHGLQFAKNFLVQQVEEIINGFTSDVFSGRYSGDSIEHPLVDRIRKKAMWLTSELSKLPIIGGGTIVPLPTLLTQGYIRPQVPEEEEDDVVFLEVRGGPSSVRTSSQVVSLV